MTYKRKKLISWTLLKLKTSALKKILLREKTSHKVGENICKDVTANKELISKIHKEHLKLNSKKKTQFKNERGFPGGAVVENLPANAGDTGSSPGLGRSHPHATEQLGP